MTRGEPTHAHTRTAILAGLFIAGLLSVGSVAAQSPTGTTTSDPMMTCPTATTTGGTTTSTPMGNPTVEAAQTTSPTATVGTSSTCPRTTSTSRTDNNAWDNTTPAGGGTGGAERGTPGFLLPLVVVAFAALAIVMRRRSV